MKTFFLPSFLFLSSLIFAQEVIPFDTTNWNINAIGYIIESVDDKQAIYIQGGAAVLKGPDFLNGSIEFDVLMRDRQSFPGIKFRAFDNRNMESFYLRPHQSGNPDANQAAPVVNGLTAWQLYFGPRYSFPYDYNLQEWTHIKLDVDGDFACIYLDFAEKPNFCWRLKHGQKSGKVAVGGSGNAAHYANFTISYDAPSIPPFEEEKTPEIEGLIKEWEVSDRFAEKDLFDLSNFTTLVKNRKWVGTLRTEENNAANISQLIDPPSTGANTVFVKLEVESNKDQLKLFEFGYSDRVVLFLNGTPLYRGNNGFRTRDYRYLGTIGLFDSVYLDLKKGNNTVLLAVSESFGGWGVMGKIVDSQGLKIN